MVYLNDRFVDESVIDLTLHKFVGYFRYPTFSIFLYVVGPVMKVLQCKCGDILRNIDEIYTHWFWGHFDERMYEDI